MSDSHRRDSGFFYSRAFGLAACLALAWAVYAIIAPFAQSLLWAASFAFILYPLHVWLTAKLRNRAQWSALLLTVLTVVMLLGPLAALGTAFINQTRELLDYLQNFMSGEGGWQQWTQHPLLLKISHWLHGNFGVTTSQWRGWLTEGAHNALQSLAGMSGQLFLGALGTAAGLFLTLFLLFFLIRDGAEIVAVARELTPMRRAQREALFEQLSQVMRAVIIGTGVTALIQGTLVGIAFVVVGLPSSLVFSVLAALLSLLPIGGTALVWIPAVLVLAAQGRWGAALFMLLWGALLVSMVDNFLKPMLISGRAQVATLTVFVGVLGGVSAFGAIGLFLGPVVLAMAIALINFSLDAKRERIAARAANADNSPDSSSDSPPDSKAD